MSDSYEFHRPIKTVDQLVRENVETICRIEKAIKEPANAGEKAAHGIVRFCGSIWFFWVHVAWFTVWILWNTMAPESIAFDPYPFSFLTFVVSLEAIFLSTFILMTQHRQSRWDDRRSQLDLQVDLLAEQENTKMLQLLVQIASKLGVNVDDSKLKILEQATRPEVLARHIEQQNKDD